MANILPYPPPPPLLLTIPIKITVWPHHHQIKGRKVTNALSLRGNIWCVFGFLLFFFFFNSFGFLYSFFLGGGGMSRHGVDLAVLELTQKTMLAGLELRSWDYRYGAAGLAVRCVLYVLCGSLGIWIRQPEVWDLESHYLSNSILCWLCGSQTNCPASFCGFSSVCLKSCCRRDWHYIHTLPCTASHGSWGREIRSNACNASALRTSAKVTQVSNS